MLYCLIMNLSTVKKILARAEDGAGPAEQANAARKLQQYLDEEQVSVEELREQLGLVDKVWVLLKGKNVWERRLAGVVTAIVCGTRHISCRPRQGSVRVLIPFNKVAEVVDKWDEFRASWRDQLDSLEIAFVHKHSLFVPKEDDEDVETEGEPLSTEELQRIRRMMDSIDQIDFRKKLE